MKHLSTTELEKIQHDKRIRRNLAYSSHYWFFSIYLHHYIQYPFAPFHHEMFRLTEDIHTLLSVIIAFRGSGKSTIMSLSFPVWAIIGKLQKKYVIIGTKTQVQAKLILSNIKQELETNELLKKDIGPFDVESNEWGAYSIVLPKFGARIAVISTEQSVRGIRHGQYRPDLVILDDIEDTNTVKTKELRDKLFNWLTSEVFPIGDKQTKIVMIGNMLHEDATLMRIEKLIHSDQMNGNFVKYPLVNDKNEILWKGKYPSFQDVEIQRKQVGSEQNWIREYLLRIVPDVDQIIRREWIAPYETLPVEYSYQMLGIDPAATVEETGDYSAIVSARVDSSNRKIYILPFCVNARIPFPELVEQAKTLSNTLGEYGRAKIAIEKVGFQKVLIQQLLADNYPAIEVPIHGQDKHARLTSISHLVQQQQILFPKIGCEDLIQQLLGFGVEKHDDLVDAFTTLVMKVIEDWSEDEQIVAIDFGNEMSGSILGKVF